MGATNKALIMANPIVMVATDKALIMVNPIIMVATGKVLVTATVGYTTLEVFIIDDDIRVRGMTH